MFLYNTGIYLYGMAIRIASLVNRKAADWLRGRRHLFRELEKCIVPGQKILWMHCSSLGEFEQGRPLLEAFRSSRPDYKILLTFFSPSGYNIRKDYPGADYIFYMPLDTPSNARRFIGIVKPSVTFFVKYEFWLNYLRELRRNEYRTYLVSAIFREDSVFFKPYGGIFRRCLPTFTQLFVQNPESRLLLQTIGINNVTVSGDTRFDRVATIAAQARDIPVASVFTSGSYRILIAGSTWEPDEDILLQLLEKFEDIKLILAPHETNEHRITALMSRLGDKAIRYTKTGEDEDISGYRVLVVDTIGLLSSVYRYGDYGYIGGGFGKGIHNTLEAAVWGLPLAFGPNYGKFREAVELIDRGCATSVNGADDLIRWIGSMEDDPDLRSALSESAGSYVRKNTGATDTVLSGIVGNIK